MMAASLPSNTVLLRFDISVDRSQGMEMDDAALDPGQYTAVVLQVGFWLIDLSLLLIRLPRLTSRMMMRWYATEQ